MNHSSDASFVKEVIVIRMRSIAVLALVLLVAALAAGCGGSADKTASTDLTTTAGSTDAAPTTPTQTVAPKRNPKDKAGTGGNLSDAPLGANAKPLVGKHVSIPTASGGSVVIDFKDFVDPVKSVSNFDVAPKGMRYLGVTIEAKLNGKPDEVKTTINIVDDTGALISLSLLADPNCGRNLVNVPGIGSEANARRGCIVAIAPKDVKAKDLLIVVHSGKDSKKVSTGRIPL